MIEFLGKRVTCWDDLDKFLYIPEKISLKHRPSQSENIAWTNGRVPVGDFKNLNNFVDREIFLQQYFQEQVSRRKNVLNEYYHRDIKDTKSLPEILSINTNEKKKFSNQYDLNLKEESSNVPVLSYINYSYCSNLFIHHNFTKWLYENYSSLMCKHKPREVTTHIHPIVLEGNGTSKFNIGTCVTPCFSDRWQTQTSRIQSLWRQSFIYPEEKGLKFNLHYIDYGVERFIHKLKNFTGDNIKKFQDLGIYGDEDCFREYPVDSLFNTRQICTPSEVSIATAPIPIKTSYRKAEDASHLMKTVCVDSLATSFVASPGLIFIENLESMINYNETPMKNVLNSTLATIESIRKTHLPRRSKSPQNILYNNAERFASYLPKIDMENKYSLIPVSKRDSSYPAQCSAVHAYCQGILELALPSTVETISPAFPKHSNQITSTLPELPTIILAPSVQKLTLNKYLEQAVQFNQNTVNSLSVNIPRSQMRKRKRDKTTIQPSTLLEKSSNFQSLTKMKSPINSKEINLNQFANPTGRNASNISNLTELKGSSRCWKFEDKYQYGTDESSQNSYNDRLVPECSERLPISHQLDSSGKEREKRNSRDYINSDSGSIKAIKSHVHIVSPTPAVDLNRSQNESLSYHPCCFDDIIDSYLQVQDSFKLASSLGITKGAAKPFNLSVLNAKQPDDVMNQRLYACLNEDVSAGCKPSMTHPLKESENLNGFQCIVSERLLSAYPSLVNEMIQSYGIQMIDFPTLLPIDVVINIDNAMTFFLYSQDTITDDLKLFVKQLTQVAFQYARIWLVMIHRENVTIDIDLMMKTLQSISQFPCKIVFREVCTSNNNQTGYPCSRKDMKAVNIRHPTLDFIHADVIYKVINKITSESRFQHDSDQSRGTMSQKLSCLSEYNNDEDSKFRFDCRILALFPSINPILAIILRSKWNLKELTRLQSNEITSVIANLVEVDGKELEQRIQLFLKLLRLHIGFVCHDE